MKMLGILIAVLRPAVPKGGLGCIKKPQVQQLGQYHHRRAAELHVHASTPAACLHLDRNILTILYEDWLQSGCDWGKSSIVTNSMREKTSRRKGRNVMRTFKSLKEMFGAAVSKQIRDRKKQMQLTKREDEEDFWKPHPECPDIEDPSQQHIVHLT